MKNLKNLVLWGKIPILFGLEGVRGQIFEKINENSNEKSKKIEFYEGKFQYFYAIC